ncbi:DNA-binding LacI/PurR family transcriptional regulator [Anaerotaenia torta]|uniref:LacI family DNA-binding transcriptional regulator n=1 Tax=Anaerotaenia torta TaxID=433293 RepID=UPI003D24E728
MKTIYDIAAELNISASTVSRVFSKPELVSENTRMMVLDKAKELGYQTNLIASQLRRRNSDIIALVSLEKRWSMYTSALSNGVQKGAEDRGYNIVVVPIGMEPKKTIRMCESMRFAGMIIAGTQLGDELYCTNNIIPLVYVNRNNLDKNVILPDDRYGIRLGMDYLFKMGHREIGYINGPATSFHSAIRYKAYEEWMGEHGCRIREEWIFDGDWAMESGYRAAVRIFSNRELPTAIVVANDEMCKGVYQAAEKFGLTVGKDISVIGYNNEDDSSCVTPKLTTVSFPLYEMGLNATQMLFDVIENGSKEEAIIVRGELIVRDSVGKL